MFSVIKNLFLSIINFFIALFGAKKSDNGYYMQIEDESPAPAQKQPQVAETKKPEPAKVEASQPKKPEPANVTTVAPATKPEAPKAEMNSKKAQPQSKETFAPQYLLPVATASRRRPGPSMNMFRDMARQVNTANNTQTAQ